MPVAAIIPAVVGAAASIYGANKSSNAAHDAANQEQAGQQAAIDEQRHQYDLSRGDEMPYMQSGTNALASINKLLSGDYSNFHTSPDYAWTLQQGLQGLDRSAAARGGLYSGGQQADVLNYGEDLASQQYNSYYNKLANLANLGQNAASGVGTRGQQSANAIGDAYGNIGNAQATATANSANAWGGAINNLGNLAASAFKPTTGTVTVGQWYDG